MSTCNLIADIITSGVQTLRLEITNMEEIVRSKRKRLHEMESLLIAIKGRPSSVSYETEELDKSISTIQTALMEDAGVQTELPEVIQHPAAPLAKPAVAKPVVNDEVSSTGSTIISKLAEKEVLKIFYRGKVVGVGIFCVDPREKKGYYIHDSRTKKKYPIMRNWTLVCKKEVNPDLKMDNPEKSVNCFRNSKWIKLEDILKA